LIFAGSTDKLKHVGQWGLMCDMLQLVARSETERVMVQRLAAIDFAGSTDKLKHVGQWPDIRILELPGLPGVAVICPLRESLLLF
jgi:hypothetical protein